MGACAPPPLFLKMKKVHFFWAEVPHLKNEKICFLNERHLLLEGQCPFCSTKDFVN
jgi:hypothetical protein